MIKKKQNNTMIAEQVSDIQKIHNRIKVRKIRQIKEIEETLKPLIKEHSEINKVLDIIKSWEPESGSKK
jgi:hypothetical protein